MSNPSPTDSRERSDDVRILDLFAVLVRNWRLLAGALIGGIVLGIILALVWPRRYVVETVLVPANANERSVGSQFLAAQLPSYMSLPGAGSADEQLIGAVLNSRTLSDSIVSRIGYVPYSGSPGEADVRRILGRHTSIQTRDDGSVAIRVRDTDADLAERIASAFPVQINGILSSVVADASGRREALLEEQLQVAHQKLQTSEHRLLSFQQGQEAPEIQEQARQTLQAAAALQQQIIEAEIEVEQLRRRLTANHPLYQAAVAELATRRGQLRRLTGGTGVAGDILVPLGESAELRVDFTRLLRDYTRDEQVYLSLARALAEAQIDANSSIPVLSVLDPPRVPQAPAGLDLRLLFALLVVLSLVIGMLACFLREYVAKTRADPANAQFYADWDRFLVEIRTPPRLGRRRPAIERSQSAPR